MQNTQKQVTLIDFERGGETSSLVAKINEAGDLVLAGVDSGQSVADHWGDWDYEYWMTVPKRSKRKVVRRLLKAWVQQPDDAGRSKRNAR